MFAKLAPIKSDGAHARTVMIGKATVDKKLSPGTAYATSTTSVAPVRPTIVVSAPQTSEAVTPSSRGSSSTLQRAPIQATSPSTATSELPALKDRPGSRDDAAFEQHPSVQAWRNYTFSGADAPLDSVEGARKLIDIILSNARRAEILKDGQTAAYWAYHIARCSFFSVQGLTSILVHRASQGTLLNGTTTTEGFREAPVTHLLSRTAVGLPAESMFAFEQDLRSIQDGDFKLPWDMTTLRHRQYNPVWVARNSATFIRDSLKVLQARGDERVGDMWFGDASNIYPKYYRNNFHYQTNGWMSSDSASVYEVQTETLFVGRQDAMQRTALVPMSRYLRSRGLAENGAAGVNILEVGAGTGRFATFVRDNFPNADMAVSDLSPFYLEKAKNNMDYWESQKKRDDSPPLGSCTFVQAAAESLPYPDNSQDVVYTVYMFHEMPDAARIASIKEMARVLKPGGLLVITDSNQWGDRPHQDKFMGAFSAMNEPHYATYLQYDFPAAFRECGLEPGMKLLQSSTKTLSATKRAP